MWTSIYISDGGLSNRGFWDTETASKECWMRLSHQKDRLFTKQPPPPPLSPPVFPPPVSSSGIVVVVVGVIVVVVVVVVVVDSTVVVVVGVTVVEVVVVGSTVVVVVGGADVVVVVVVVVGTAATMETSSKRISVPLPNVDSKRTTAITSCPAYSPTSNSIFVHSDNSLGMKDSTGLET